MSVQERVDEARTTGSPERLSELARDPSADVRRQVAANRSTTREALAELVADRDWRIRGAVAAQPDVPAAAAIALVDDKAWQVRYALAENRHTDPAVWRAILNARRTDIRGIFAGHAWLPDEIVQALVSDPATDVRGSLARLTTHRTILDQLLNDPHQNVRANGLRNTLATEADVIAGAHDRNLVVRAEAAEHPLLPEAELQRLRDDRSEWVRDQANRAWSSRRAGRPQTRGPDLDDFIIPALAELPEVMRLLGAAVPADLPAALTPPDLTDPQILAAWPTTPTKPRTKWMRMFSSVRPSLDVVSDDVAWFWRYCEQIDRDPQWKAWWAPAEHKRLDISLQPGRWLRYEIEERRGTLHVQASFPQLEAFFESLGPQAWSQVSTDELVRRQLPCLEATCSLVAKVCDLAPPPALPPH